MFGERALLAVEGSGRLRTADAIAQTWCADGDRRASFRSFGGRGAPYSCGPYVGIRVACNTSFILTHKLPQTGPKLTRLGRSSGSVEHENRGVGDSRGHRTSDQQVGGSNPSGRASLQHYKMVCLDMSSAQDVGANQLMLRQHLCRVRCSGFVTGRSHEPLTRNQMLLAGRTAIDAAKPGTVVRVRTDR